jgi:hypothetical protein
MNHERATNVLQVVSFQTGFLGALDPLKEAAVRRQRALSRVG